jgi:hypothetical protein
MKTIIKGTFPLWCNTGKSDISCPSEYRLGAMNQEEQAMEMFALHKARIMAISGRDHNG